jgi:drug/metabolite transporter (DMT)-like permease
MWRAPVALSPPRRAGIAEIDRPAGMATGRQNTAMQPNAPQQGSPFSIAVNLGIVYLIWGSTYLAIRVMVETVPPFLGAGSRYLVAGLLMLAFLRIRAGLSRVPGARVERVTWREWRSAAIVGGLLLLGGNGFVVMSEQRIDSGVAAVLIAAVPIWMNLIDAILRRRRPSALAMGGVAAGFLGVLVLLAPVGGVSAADPVGIGMAVFASMSWASGSIYARHAPMPRSGLLATGMEMLAGGALLAIAAAATGQLSGIDLAAYSTRSLVAIGYLVVFGSLVAFSSYTWLLKSAPVSTVATYAYVNPIVAVVLGALLLGETLTPRTIVAALLIIGAVVAMVSGRPREAEEMAPAPEPVLEVVELADLPAGSGRTDDAADPAGG